MKTREAIARADALRPNAVVEEQKANWLYELDGRVAEFMGAPLPEQKWPDDAEHLMPWPYDNIYVLYLCTRDTGSAVYNALADLVGIYVEEAS